MPRVPETPLGNTLPVIPGQGHTVTPSSADPFNEALERLGTTVRRVGGVIGDIAVKEKSAQTNADIDRAFIEWSEERNKILHGPAQPGQPTPYFALQGEDAVSGGMPARDALAASMEERVKAFKEAGGYGDDSPAISILSNRILTEINQDSRSISKNETKWREQTRDGINEALADELTRQGIAETLRDEPDVVKIETYLDGIFSATLSRLEEKGVPPELRSGIAYQRRSDAMVDIITSASSTNPALARQLLTDWSEVDPSTKRSYLNENEIGELEDVVSSAEETEAGISFAQEVWGIAQGEDLSETEALKVISMNAPGLKEKALRTAKAELSKFYAADRRTREDAYDKAIGDVVEHVEDGGSADEWLAEHPNEKRLISEVGGPSVLNNLRTQEANARENRLHRLTTDGVSYPKWANKIRRDPDADIRGARPETTAEEFEQLKQIQQKAQDRARLSETDDAPYQRGFKMARNMYKNFQWEPFTRKGRRIPAPQFQIDAIDNAIHDFVKRSLDTQKREPTEQELRTHINEIMLPMLADPRNTGFANVFPKPGEEEFEGVAAQAVDMSPAQARVAIVPFDKIPPWLYKRLADGFRKEGIDVTNIPDEVFEKAAGTVAISHRHPVLANKRLDEILANLKGTQ